MTHFTVSNLTGTVTLDETSGLQNDFTSNVAGDDDDNDIAFDKNSQGLLPLALWTWLTSLASDPVDVALSNYDGSDSSFASTKMVDISGSSLDPLRFSSDSTGTPLPVYDPSSPPADVSAVGFASGIYDLDGNQIYLFEMKDDPNLVIGVDATGQYSLAVYLDQTTFNDGQDQEARIWTVELEPLKHPNPADDDEAISLDNKLYLTSVDNLNFDASNSPSGQNLFIMFGTGDGNYDFGIVATGRSPVDESDPLSPGITAGDTVNTSQAGGPTTFGINNQMLTASAIPGEGDGIVFTYVTNTNSDYTVPNLDQNEADVEANIDFGTFFNATTATFDVVQLQGGKTAELKITAWNSTRTGDQTAYVNNQDDDIADLGTGTIDPADIGLLMITGTRGKKNSPDLVEFNADVSIIGYDTRTAVTDGAYTIWVTFHADGEVTIEGLVAGDKITFTTVPEVGNPTGEHNRVLIENVGDGSGQDSANFDIGGFQIMDVSPETVEIGDRIFWEDDGPAIGVTAPEIVEEEQINNAYSVGNEDAILQPLLDTDTPINLNAVTQTSTVDFNAVITAGTDEQAIFTLDASGVTAPTLTSRGAAVNFAPIVVTTSAATALVLGDLIPDGTYTIMDTVPAHDFAFNASGNTLQDLINAINGSLVATAELVSGELVLTSLNGDPLELDGFDNVATNMDTAAETYTLTGTVVSISGATAKVLSDGIADDTYKIMNTLPADDFSLTTSGNTLQELIDAINLSTVATAELVGGNLVIESLNGDPLYLEGFDNIAASLTDGTYDDTREVVTWSVTGDGMATLTVSDQVDHATLDGLLGDNTENTLLIDFQDYLNVTDGDGDPVSSLGDLGKYNVLDDIPIEADTETVGVVEEEHGLTGGNEDTTGGAGSYTDGDTLVGPDYNVTKNTVSGNLQSLVLVGTDEVVGGGASFSLLGLSDLTQAELDALIVALGLWSQGEQVTKADVSVPGTLTAKTTDGDPIFSLSVQENGDYTFTLIRTLDHDAPVSGAVENLETIDLTDFIKAEDFDGDEIILGTSGDGSSSLLIKAIDDIPIETDMQVVGVVEEEHGLTGGNEDTTGGAGSYTDDDTLVGPDYNVTKNTVSGSLAALVSVGADAVSGGGATFSLVGLSDLSQAELDALIVALDLSSQGEDVTKADVSVPGTLTARTTDGDAIFTLTLAANGDYTFTLNRNLDNPDPPAGAGEDVLTIDLTSFVKATDFDGDTIFLGTSGDDSSSFLIKAIDDIPILEVGNIAGTGTVDPQIGEWNGPAGADGYKSLTIELVSFTYGPSLSEVTVTPEQDLGTPTVGSDGELIYTGSITADFDGNPLNGTETLNFELTFNPDGTYVFNLDETFASKIDFSSADGALPAGGPDSVQTLPVPVGGTTDNILFFALNPLANPVDVVNDALDPVRDEATLEFENPSFLDPAFLMNVSTSGIGVNNNVLEGNKTAGINAGDESFIVNPETPVTQVKVYIDNSVAGYDTTSEFLYYRVYWDDGDFETFELVSAGDLTAEASGQVSFTIDWEVDGDGTRLIDAVQLVMAEGKIKIPTIEFTQELAVVADPITIDFEAVLTDNDNDTATDLFSVDIGTDPDPFITPDIVFTGIGTEMDAFNIDLASGLTDWVINGFSLVDGDKVVLLNPLHDYVLTPNGAGDDTITINGATVTITNGSDVLTDADILVAFSEKVVDDYQVGTAAGETLTGAADVSDALIGKGGADTLTGNTGGDVFVFIAPGDGPDTVTDFDAADGDIVVISASGFDVEVDEGALTGSGNFVSGAGAVALDGDDYFIFDETTNELKFDADGNGAGAAVVIADFGAAVLTGDDIFMIA